MDNIAIKVDKVNKSFVLPHEKKASVKSIFLNIFERKRTFERQEVLKNISFEIEKGDFFGVVGRNGSGKSTLLKILARIYEPNSGSVQIDGKLIPFIELGVGFNPELTGRENVYLNGALLGFNRKEMVDMYDEIVGFAELEKFMDQKLKNYSSGMQVRLAFSIAIRAKGDILVLDEVLAVGDEAFQRKCVAVFDEYKKNKRTVVLVTHDMSAVKKYCNKAILIDQGKISKAGNPHEIATMYSKLNQDNNPEEDQSANYSKLKIKMIESDSKINMRYKSGGELKVQLSWPKDEPVELAGVAIYSSIGECVYATNTELDKIDIKKRNSINYSADLSLGAGNYFLMAGIWAKDKELIEFIDQGPKFSIEDDVNQVGEGLVRLEHRWG